MSTTVGTPPGVTASGYQVPPPLTPNQITGLFAWWDAADLATIIDAGAGAVSQWNDKSSNGRNLTSTTAANRPITGTRTMNGRNVLDFVPATGVQMNITPMTLPQPYTAIVVAQSDEADTNPHNMISAPQAIRTSTSLWQMSAGTTLSAGADDGNRNVHICTYDGATSTYHLNDVLRATGNAGTLGMAGVNFRVGHNTAANTWDGTIAEIILYDRILTGSERGSLQAGLKQKWNTP